MENISERPNLDVDYRTRRKEILNGIMLSFLISMKRMLIVWSPNYVVRPDFVVSALTKCDTEAEVYDHWIRRSVLSKEKTWLGAVVEYSYENLPAIAAKDAREHTKFIRTIFFKDYLDILIEAEIRHPDFKRRGTWVLIKASRSFLEYQIYLFELDLHEFGNVLDVHFYSGYEHYGLICEVKYEFASQAIAAQTLLNGQSRRNVGHLTVEIEETVKEKTLMGYVRDRIQEIEYKESKKTMEDLFIYF